MNPSRSMHALLAAALVAGPAHQLKPSRRQDGHRGKRVRPRHMDAISAELWCKSHVFLDVEGGTLGALDVEALVEEMTLSFEHEQWIRHEALRDVLKRIHTHLGDRDEFKAMAIHDQVLALVADGEERELLGVK